MFEIKKTLIDEYISQIDTFDLFSETYRGGREYNLYKPLGYDFIFSKWKEFIKINPNGVLDLYIHIPFCLKLCSYCNYYKNLANGNNIDEYVLKYLIPYLSEIANIFKGFKFNSLYIGGGTPSIININSLNKLLSFIDENIGFINGAEKTFEGNPVSLTSKKIEILSKYKINRVSMGVQSLNQNTLLKANREYQNLEIIKRVINDLNNFGINNINIDLLIGLDENEKDDFLFSLGVFSKLDINFITAYWLTPTKKYLSNYFKGNNNDFYNNLNKQVDSIYNALINNISKFNFEYYDIDKLSNHCWKFQIKSYSNTSSYTDIGDNSILGIGPSSRSYINGSLVYSTLEYIPNEFNIKKYDVLGKIINIYDEMLLYIIINIRDNGFINTVYIYEKFGIDFKKLFNDEINFLFNNLYLKFEQDNIIFSDNISKKYYSILFFFTLETLNIKNIIINKLNLNKSITFKGIDIDIKVLLNNNKIDILINTDKVNIKNIDNYNIIIIYIIKLSDKFNNRIFSIYDLYNLFCKYFNNKFKNLIIKLNI